MSSANAVISALEASLEASRQRQTSLTKAITDKIDVLEGPKGDNFLAKLNAELNALIDAVNATGNHLDALEGTVNQLALFVLREAGIE